jgi:hypothetical protein
MSLSVSDDCTDGSSPDDGCLGRINQANGKPERVDDSLVLDASIRSYYEATLAGYIQP